MEIADLEGIVASLQGEANRLGEKRAELKRSLDKIDSELQRVQAGLVALKGKRASKTRGGKQSPNKDVVREAARHCLANGSVLNHDALKDAVGEKVIAAGYSRMGLALRLREVLAEDGFSESLDGYRIERTGEQTHSQIAG